MLRRSCTQMKNKLFENESKVIFEIASSIITQSLDNFRYCIRRRAQYSSVIF